MLIINAGFKVLGKILKKIIHPVRSSYRNAVSDGPNSLGQRECCQFLYLASVQRKSPAVPDICQYQINCLVKYGEQNTGEVLFPLQSIMKCLLISKGSVINIWGNV